MVSQDMVKQAYAQGAYQALKEAGYDDQTAAQIATDMAKKAAEPVAPTIPLKGMPGLGAPRPAPMGPALKGRPTGLAGTMNQPPAPTFSPPVRPQ